MKNDDTLTRILALVGTFLIWFPILAPILLSVALLIQERVFRFDYLMPAELFLAALGGACSLIWASLRARSRRIHIGSGFAIAVGLLIGSQFLAVVTGLASGETEPTGWPFVLVQASMGGYSLSLVVVGVGGIMLLRDLFKPHHPPKSNS
jgi:hypothetical protein